jgi:DNA-binding CsgD family transcriptional regulator
MEHVRMAGYALALILGAASIMETFMIWQRYRRVVLRRYGLFLVALFLILFAFAVDQYARIAAPNPPPAVLDAVWLLQAAGGCLFIVVCPFLFHALVGRDLSRAGTAVFAVIDALVILTALANVAFPRVTLIPLALGGLLFAMILWAIVFTAVSLGRVGERALRRALIVLLGLTIVFLPLMALDVALGFVPALAVLTPLNNLAQPAYFLVLNCLTIVFGLRSLNRPAYAEAGKLTPFFIEAFGITDREAEVIGLLLEGKTGPAIAEALFISPKTAENHMTNIYQKLGVHTRVQLYQLVRSNSLD